MIPDRARDCTRRQIPLLALMAFLISCAHEQNPTRERAALQEIVQIGVPRSPPLASQGRWSCQVSGSGPSARCSIWAQNAPVSDLVDELLQQSSTTYYLAGVRLSGRCSLQLADVSLLTALNAVLRGLEAEAQLKEQANPPLICIGNRNQPQPVTRPPSARQEPLVSTVVRLNHRKADLIVSELLGTRPDAEGIWKNESGLTVGVSPESNRLYLRGRPEEVQRAVQICRAADQPSPRVRLEVAFFSTRPNKDSVTQNPQWTLSSDNSYIRWKPAAVTLGDGLVAGYQQQATPDALNWVSKHELNTGRLVGHSELVVETGETSSIQIGRTGYIVVTTLSSGVPSGQQQQIDASTRLNLTPYALPSGLIQLEFQFDNARFTPSTTLKAATKLRSETTKLTIPAGAWVCLGGAAFSSTDEARLSFPWLQNVPVVGQLITAFSSSYTDDVVIQYVRASLIDEEQDDPLATSIKALPSIPISDDAEGIDGNR
jgi:hypothetical protein